MILDELDQITLSDADATAYATQIGTLRRLAVGLTFLYEQVRTNEVTLAEPWEKERVFIVGNLPMPPKQQALLECAFHWYAISACNFAQLTGWMHHRDHELAKQYVTRVLPGPQVFRNKIGAHFAMADRDKNLAERAASVMPQLGWSEDRFRVSVLTLTIGRKGEQHSSAAVTPWSLTEIHEGLRSRFPLLRP